MDKETIIKYLEELESVVDDINALEISKQIAFGTLKEFCERWQGAAICCLKEIRNAL